MRFINNSDADITYMVSNIGCSKQQNAQSLYNCLASASASTTIHIIVVAAKRDTHCPFTHTRDYCTLHHSQKQTVRKPSYRLVHTATTTDYSLLPRNHQTDIGV